MEKIVNSDKIQKISKIIKELETCIDLYGDQPFRLVDEDNKFHRIDNFDVEIEGLSTAFVVANMKFLRHIRESKVEIAMERSVADLSKFENAVQIAVGCENETAIRILEELNAQDYLLLSGDDYRQIRNHIKQMEQDIEFLRGSLKERNEIAG
jgi:hypothetical protein